MTIAARIDNAAPFPVLHVQSVAHSLTQEFSEDSKLEQRRLQEDEQLRSRIGMMSLFTIVVLLSVAARQLVLLNRFFRSVTCPSLAILSIVSSVFYSSPVRVISLSCMEYRRSLSLTCSGSEASVPFQFHRNREWVHIRGIREG